VSGLYLFWDVDGTLLTTNRAGIFAWEEAAAAVLGGQHDFQQLRTAGLTDYEIAELIGGPENAAALLRAYEDALPAYIERRRGRVLPNVRENLEHLSHHNGVVNMLLTGNVEGGARAKLTHYGLWQFFHAGGAFCVEGADRPSIARQARELAAGHGGEVPPGERMVVIGDTPHDVACGKEIGARTVAVATGPDHGLAELRAAQPWALLESLPARGLLCELLGL
jgi:phosphoglycolate phosphatase